MTKKVRLNVDRLLKQNGYTQEEFKELTGIRQAAISNLSRGFVSRVDISHIERIANALDISDINEIITIVDE